MDSDQQTVPITDLYLETVTHHNRLYQRFAVENGTYFAPIDDDEEARLQYQHTVLSQLFVYKLIFAPITRPRRILDCGFGTAAWATEVADEHPECEVIGVDISPHMAPPDQAPNLYLQQDDLNKPFTFGSNKFDLVHSQLVCGGINVNRWRGYLEDIHKSLRRGGWVQLVEIYFNAQSDNGSLTENHGLRTWSRAFLESLQQYKNPRVPQQLATLARDAGFVEVEMRMMQLPTCGWPTDPAQRQIGIANRANVRSFLSSLARYPMMEFLDMSRANFELLVAQARSEADDPALKAYFPVYVCIGRKRR